ncbi:MAG: glycosyltransferase family 39 protein [Gemmatimonadetes bacterium]|nr:glycosyltransferase family 39 protein [Gemmatimonadota bacterium]
MLAARLVLIPTDASISSGFLHDSAYIGIVARNLLAGHGYVNDANWLLFLNPEQLPMYFHNANPGYPTATAGVMALAGLDAARAMLVVSILGAGLIAIGAWGITRHVVKDRQGWLPVLAGASALLFPANWRLSFVGLPDALATGLVLCLFAVLLHARATWHWVAAGLLFGLAWLVRSTATVALPAVALWSLARHGWGTSIRRGLLVAGTAAMVMLPWLVHTAKVRGSPFASDASYYLLLRYHAERTGRDEDQFYRSLQPPPSTGEVMRQDPVGVARSAATGFPVVLYRIGAGLAEWDKLVALALFAALGVGAFAVRRSAWLPELAAGGLLWLILVGTLAIRGNSIEIRYFSVGSALLSILLVAAVPGTTATRRWWYLAPVALYLAIGVIPQDFRMLRSLPQVNADHAALREAMNAAATAMPSGTRAVTQVPYFFTYHTGRGAMSPAYPGKAELLQVMERYQGSVVLLPTDSLDYYYPGSPASLVPELQGARPMGRFTLLQRDSTSTP